MTTNDMAPLATPSHDTPRIGAGSEFELNRHGDSQASVEHNEMQQNDAASHDTGGDDRTRQHAALRQSSYTLTVEQIMQRLDVEGVSKSKRTVQRYFSRGEIDAKLVTTSEGQRWLANELDAARFIEDLKRREALALMTRPDGIAMHGFNRSAPMPERTAFAHPAPAPSEDTARHDADTARLEERVAQMTERLTDANAQITHLRDQVKDANEHVRLWSDRAKELKDLLQAQTEGNAPVLAALAKSIEAQARATSRNDAAPRASEVISIS